MKVDMLGKRRYQVNLHTHTSLSDGRLSPEEVVELYAARGYDAVLLSDHWHYGEERWAGELLILSGAEYNVGGRDSAEGVFHVVGFGMERDPMLSKDGTVQEIINGIHQAGGLAILAHPAWSLNTPEQIMELRRVDATEIYNSVSGVHNSRRADSSLIVDMLASRGRYYPLVAADDTHYYDGTDNCRSWIMAEAEELTSEALKRAVAEGRFYATQGPELHLIREGDGIVVKCSPCAEVVLLSNLVWAPRVFQGEGLTEVTYRPLPDERYVRAVVMDSEGRYAWSNMLVL